MLAVKQKTSLHSMKIARKCVVMQTKTFGNQPQRKRDLHYSSNACICSLL